MFDDAKERHCLHFYSRRRRRFYFDRTLLTIFIFVAVVSHASLFYGIFWNVHTFLGMQIFIVSIHLKMTFIGLPINSRECAKNECKIIWNMERRWIAHKYRTTFLIAHFLFMWIHKSVLKLSLFVLKAGRKLYDSIGI